MINGTASVMLGTMVFNASVGSTALFVASYIGLFMGTATRVVVGSRDKGFEKLDLKSKGGERLVGYALTAVGAGERARETSGVEVVLSLEVMAA